MLHRGNKVNLHNVNFRDFTTILICFSKKNSTNPSLKPTARLLIKIILLLIMFKCLWHFSLREVHEVVQRAPCVCVCLLPLSLCQFAQLAVQFK